MESPLDVQLVSAVRRCWALLIVLTVVGAWVGFGVSTVMSPVYKGTASLLVGDFESGEASNNQIQAVQSLTATYADIGRREPVLSGAAQDLGLADWRELRETVDIVVPKESPQVIEISVEGGDRQQVKEAAGAIAERLMEYVDPADGAGNFVSPQLSRLEESIADGEDRVDKLRREQSRRGEDAPAWLAVEINRTQAQITAWQNNYVAFKELSATSSQVVIRQLDRAEAAATPVRPNVRFNTAMAGLAGLLVAMAAAYLLESRRARRTPDEYDPLTAVPLVGAVDLAKVPVPVPVNGRSARTARADHEGDRQ